MAKKINPENVVGDDLDKVVKKIKEFQDYLELNNIVSKVTNGNEIILSEENQDKLHKEMLLQMKAVDAVLSWIPLVKKHRELEDSTTQTRGDIEVGGHFKDK